jgi:hypothetical protein
MRGSTVAEMTHDVSEETIERVNVRLANFMLCGSSASLKNWALASLLSSSLLNAGNRVSKCLGTEESLKT